MNKWIKIILTIGFTVVILFAGITLFAYYELKGSLPEYDGEIEISGIKKDVNILRDSVGIPYIKAESKEDAAFALGYVHAQERLFQMDIFRRVVEGRLSEIMGSKTVRFDRLFRTFGFYKNHKNYFNKLSSETQRILIAYSNGVNKFIETHKDDLPPEFILLDYVPEKWEPYESVLIAKLLAYQLNLSWWTDITFTKIAQKLGKEKAKLFLPNFPENAPTIIPDKIFAMNEISDELIKLDKNLRDYLGFTGTHIGSNNWVVSSSHSASKKPIIANDPHLAHQLPGIWYLAVINSPEWKVAGVTIPGVPGVVIGNAGKISWVLTNVMADDSDYYLEKIDSSGTKYFLDGKWENLKTYSDTIFVKDGNPVVFNIRKTHRGPIISDVYTFGTNGENISMRWVGLDATNELDAFITINKATNWEEFKEGVRKFSVPGQNFVYADNEGNIGYYCGVKLPIRRTNNITFVFDGTTSKSDWIGYVPFDELPHLYNPKQGFIATANNKTIKNYKYHISNLWEPPSRIERITELLKGKEKHSAEDFKNYQNDFVSPYARELTPFIINSFANENIRNENIVLSLNLLKNWDFKMSEISQSASIYSVFFIRLLHNTFEDDLGKSLFNEYLFLANVPYRKISEIIYDNKNPIWDDTRTEKIETRDEIIRRSFSETILELKNKFGNDVANWRWGRLHFVTFKHSFHGVSSILNKILDVGPFPIGGGGTTVFNTEYKFTKPFENILGPSMRYIYDFANPDYFYIVLPTGQSGHFMNKHYKDMTVSWLKGKYFTVDMVNSFNNKKNKKLILVAQ